MLNYQIYYQISIKDYGEDKHGQQQDDTMLASYNMEMFKYKETIKYKETTALGVNTKQWSQEKCCFYYACFNTWGRKAVQIIPPPPKKHNAKYENNVLMNIHRTYM